MIDSYLPIGTIVTLKGSNQKIMINGYFGSDEKKVIYEYSGCTYPEGLIDSNKGLLFNHNSIKEIIYKGLNDDEVKEHLNKIMSLSKQYTSILFNIATKVLKNAMDGEKNG